MSEVATYQNFIASITHDNMRPSVDTILNDVYYLDSQFHCFILYYNPITLIVTLSFLSFSNIRYARLFLRCSYLSS